MELGKKKIKYTDVMFNPWNHFVFFSTWHFTTNHAHGIEEATISPSSILSYKKWRTALVSNRCLAPCNELRYLSISFTRTSTRSAAAKTPRSYEVSTTATCVWRRCGRRCCAQRATPWSVIRSSKLYMRDWEESIPFHDYLRIRVRMRTWFFKG
jgi:hypothetical protein